MSAEKERPLCWLEWMLVALMALLMAAVIGVFVSGGSSEVAGLLAVGFITSAVFCATFSAGANWGWSKGRNS